jgi:hypothetical protein
MPTEPKAVDQVLPSPDLVNKVLPVSAQPTSPPLPVAEAGAAVAPHQTAAPPVPVPQTAGVAGDGPRLAPAATHPPVGAAAAAVTADAAAGLSSGTVTSLWSINEDRNSWVGIADKGWVKLSTASDTGVIALTALASHAKAANRYISYATDNSKELTQIYVW